MPISHETLTWQKIDEAQTMCTFRPKYVFLCNIWNLVCLLENECFKPTTFFRNSSAKRWCLPGGTFWSLHTRCSSEKSQPAKSSPGSISSSTRLTGKKNLFMPPKLLILGQLAEWYSRFDPRSVFSYSFLTLLLNGSIDTLNWGSGQLYV